MIIIGIIFSAVALLAFALMALSPCCKWGGKRDDEP